MPDTFLPVAEEIGLLRALDSWVLRSAVQQTAAWNDTGQTFDVAINLTVYSLQDPALIGEVKTLLTRTGVPPQHIVIELTEHSALRDPETVQQVLHGLRDLGLRVALDDFGSGYASLANLQQIPVDILKVDRAFTAGIEREPRDEAVVMALLALGRGMHIGVVVEGVEDDAQLIWLRQAGCSQAQGYWIGRPVPANLIVGRDIQQG
jgi:EAL domain-containing protein (putative c-di-GMP-specific phosphodiesterase class I)